MKSPAENILHLQKINRKLKRIINYAQGLNYAEFVTMQSRREAILKQLHQISEEAFLLSEEFINHYRKVDFKALKGFRNIHYRYQFQSDSHVLWKRISNVLPKIQKTIEAAIYQLEIDSMITMRRAA